MNNKCKIMLVTILTIAISCVNAFAQTKTIDINEACNIALKDSFAIKVAENNVDRANDSYEKSQKDASDAEDALMFNQRVNFLSQKKDKTKQEESEFAVFEKSKGKLLTDNQIYELTIVKDINPMYTWNSLAASKKNLEDSKKQIKFNVANTYLNILANQIRITSLEKDSDNSGKIIDSMEWKYIFGLISKVELEKTKLQSQNDINNLDKMKEDLDLSKQKLNQIMRLPLDYKFDVVDLEKVDYILADKPVDMYIKAALSTRGEINNAQNYLDVVDKEAEISEKIYIVGINPHIIAEKNKLEIAKIDLDTAKRNIKKAIENKYNDYTERKKEYKNALEICKQAIERYNIGILKNKFMLITDNDLVNLKNSIEKANNQKKLSIYSLISSYNSLNYYSGFEQKY